MKPQHFLNAPTAWDRAARGQYFNLPWSQRSLRIDVAMMAFAEHVRLSRYERTPQTIDSTKVWLGYETPMVWHKRPATTRPDALAAAFDMMQDVADNIMAEPHDNATTPQLVALCLSLTALWQTPLAWQDISSALRDERIDDAVSVAISEASSRIADPARGERRWLRIAWLFTEPDKENAASHGLGGAST